MPNLPPILAGKTVDLLNWYDRDKIAQSKNLPVLIINGSLTLIKTKDSNSQRIPSSKGQTLATPHPMVPCCVQPLGGIF